MLHVQDALELNFQMTLGSASERHHGGSWRADGEYRVGRQFRPRVIDRTFVDKSSPSNGQEVSQDFN